MVWAHPSIIKHVKESSNCYRQRVYIKMWFGYSDSFGYDNDLEL